MGGRNQCIVVSIWYLFSSYRDADLAKLLKRMVAEEGLEPPTRGL